MNYKYFRLWRGLHYDQPFVKKSLLMTITSTSKSCTTVTTWSISFFNVCFLVNYRIWSVRIKQQTRWSVFFKCCLRKLSDLLVFNQMWSSWHKVKDKGLFLQNYWDCNDNTGAQKGLKTNKQTKETGWGNCTSSLIGKFSTMALRSGFSFKGQSNEAINKTFWVEITQKQLHDTRN